MNVQRCTLYSPIGSTGTRDIFFSTTWCRDRLFTSENSKDILRFYETFRDGEELIQWMNERPKGRAETIEVDGSKDIIVVIPTADFEGKFARECRENIFKGLHLVFVESGYPRDPYFNYAHNCNVGIKKAMQYNPKWVVVSNDDMIKIDDMTILQEELRKKDWRKLKTVFTRPSKYHSLPVCIGIPRAVIGSIVEYFYLLARRNMNTRVFMASRRLSRKFGARWVYASKRNLFKKIFYKETRCYILTSDFSIFSGEWLKSLDDGPFDETYINGVEDWELSLNLYKNKEDYDFIDYRIGDLIGGSVGEYWGNRNIRDVANMVYFSHKISDLMPVSETWTGGR